MGVVDMVNKLNNIVKEKDGQRVIVAGKPYSIKDSHIIEEWANHNKFMPMEMTRGKLEIFLEFLDDDINKK